MNSHEAALRTTLDFIGLDTDIVEIAYKAPFGFREINRENIEISTFLNPEYQKRHAVGLLHILLGCGVSIESLVDVVNKALTLCDRVLILEHNRASQDWDWSNQDLVTEHELLNCLTYTDMWNLCEICGWLVCRAQLIPGDTPDRNMIIELFGGMVGWNHRDKYELIKNLGIPIFDTTNAPENYKHLCDVYVGTAENSTILFASTRNDSELIEIRRVSVHTRKEFQNIVCPTLTTPWNVYACGGGFFSLDHLHLLRESPIKSIRFFDVNKYTMEFGEAVIELIKMYPSRIQFLQHYLLANITLAPIPRIIQTSWSDRIRLYLSYYQYINDTGKELLRLILNSDILGSKLRVYGLRNCSDNRTDHPGYLELTHVGDKYIEENSLKVGQEGWLESDQSYLETRNLLINTPYSFTVCGLDDLTPAKEDLVLASNIYSGNGSTKDFMPCRIIHHADREVWEGQ